VHNEIHHEAGYLAQRLLNLVREEVYLRYAGYFRTGRLNKAKLWKQRIGNYRLFQRQVPGSSHAVAFSLLVDESASMKGQDKYKLAMKTALLLGETLDFVGVPLEIIGYTTEDYEARSAMRLGLTPAHAYRATRCSALEHRIYKRFDEPYYAVRARLTGIEPRHNNWDEEHLIFAFQRIQERPERRKVMIIISDGQPNGDANFLIQTVKKIESAGCRLIGIGIGADFVKEIYTTAVVVNDFSQLGEELIQILAHEFRASAV
jgi:cobalamin biosynthesis protein CobT